MNYNEYGQRIEYIEYTVKKGDSIYSIAKKFDTSVSTISDVNMLTNTTIFPGQILLVPKGSNKETEFYFENYVVKPNDTIELIAKRLGIDPVLIGMYNDFGILKLKEEQIIKIPRNESYTIKETDTLDSILSSTNRSADELLRANASVWLKPGNKILL